LPLTSATHRATFTLPDQRSAKQAVDVLTEIVFEDEAAVAAFERPDGRWDVTVHFADAPDQALVRHAVGNAAGADVASTIAFDTVEAKDWVTASLEDLMPVPAGRFVVHGAHDRARIAPNKLGIEIEAALAFGTGHHGTTRGCLLALNALAKRRRRQRKTPDSSPLRRRRGRKAGVLDIGTGTGVLAIAAAKALRCPVLASDIDARSAAIARDNARINRVGDMVEVIHTGGVGAARFRAQAPYALVFANILLGPLTQLATPIARLVGSNGHVVLSGLLTAQADAAVASYRARGLVLVRRIRLEGWATLVLARVRRGPHR